jgi:hypothetical protein
VPADGYVVVRGDLEVYGQAYSALTTLQTPAADFVTVDWNNGNSQILSLAAATGDVAVTMINARSGASYILEVVQHASAAKNIVWMDNVRFPDSVLPIVSTGSNAIDIFSFFYDGTRDRFFGVQGANYAP